MRDGTIRPTSWGSREIRGPVHLFREGLLLRLLLPRLGDGGRVLDAGCGSGSLALQLARGGFSVDAVERSPEFVQTVRHKASRYGQESRVSVHQGSVTSLPFAAAVFDGVVCGEVLEHVAAADGGDRAAAAELSRVARPGAAVVVSVPQNPRLWDESDVWAGHVKRYTRAELVGLLEAAGLRVEVVRSWGFPLGRLYHRLLFGPWIRRTAALKPAERDVRADTRAAANRLLVAAVAGALRFDELFAQSPRGRGLVAAARRA